MLPFVSGQLNPDEEDDSDVDEGMPEAGALPNEDFDDDLNPGGGQGQGQQDQEEEGIVLDEQVEAGVNEEDEDEVEEQQINLNLEEIDVVGSPRVSIDCFQSF